MALVPFSSVDRGALRWLRSSPTAAEFQLLSGDSPLGTLAWSKSEGSLAVAQTIDRKWSFKRVGFLHPHVTARLQGETKDVARLASHVRHHRIELPGGATFDLQRAGLLVPAWQLRSGDGLELLHVEPVREGRRLEGGIVQVAPEARDRPELALLTFLTWYYIVLAWAEDEAVSEWTDHAESRF